MVKLFDQENWFLTNKHRKSSKILDHLISEEAGGKTIQCHLFGTKCARFSLTDLSIFLFVDLPPDVLMLTHRISIQSSKVSNCGRIEPTFTLQRQTEIWILENCVTRRIQYFSPRRRFLCFGPAISLSACDVRSLVGKINCSYSQVFHSTAFGQSCHFR